MRIIRSKPAVLIGLGALARKLAKQSEQKKRKSRVGQALSGMAIAGAAGGAIKYFTDSLQGPMRREKIKSIVSKKETHEWGSTGDSFASTPDIPAGTSTEALTEDPATPAK